MWSCGKAYMTCVNEIHTQKKQMMREAGKDAGGGQETSNLPSQALVTSTTNSTRDLHSKKVSNM